MRAAAIQLNSTPDRASNLRVAESLVRRAAASGAELVVLPEKWPLLGTPAQTAAGAEPLDGPTSEWSASLARELGVDLVAGSFSERVESSPRGHNTCLHVGPDGAIRARYRKLHMFDSEVAGTVYRESDVEAPGDEVVLSATDSGVGLGLAICYDLRFPELFRLLALAGARIVALPSAFTETTTLAHWDVLVRARAIENSCFVVAANQFGSHAPGSRSGGRSMIVDPWGTVLAQAPDGEGLAIADLDLARQDEIRVKLPSLANRRPAAYGWPQSAPGRLEATVTAAGSSSSPAAR